MALFKTCKPSLLSKDGFIHAFADIYEHSSWVAEETYKQGITPADDHVESLHMKMAAVLLRADKDSQLTLILAHPDLAGKAAINGELTQASTSEQAGAGIDQCTAEEFEMFNDFNQRYKEKFEFPFIMAVKGANRFQILDAFEHRLDNAVETEFSTALNEINKIALFRLLEM
ncbi:OHCU decarboxylase [Vibrio sp. vnigr-6D03]|uniref:2-oxo-4-hydroxy-4-carboxy-5-ureidoimidazoline decarboxylase n=1 Tax=Vibrio sp. vnigr-6D03 TaxID=2058088 RepID=UPI000C31C315|nr:2-oxo-4-hydroxy-4-carboxy-5-ureidoimidazoline decarboxylase [Vibrio sp. vnigr-6D03]PKF81221.1 OHCU decarboxylase [Vibrio sp. vnigr-6D03]